MPDKAGLTVEVVDYPEDGMTAFHKFELPEPCHRILVDIGEDGFINVRGFVACDNEHGEREVESTFIDSTQLTTDISSPSAITEP